MRNVIVKSEDERVVDLKLKPLGGTIDYLPEDQTKLSRLCSDLSAAQVTIIMEKLRNAREFYKRIMAEERRVKHPNSFRYEDAMGKITYYNSVGPLLKTVLQSKTQS